MPEVLASEIMAAAGARELRDGEVVVVGLGLPQVACVLAQRTHAPRLSALLEIGVMNMSPIDTAVGLADPRIWYRASGGSWSLDPPGICWRPRPPGIGPARRRSTSRDHRHGGNGIRYEYAFRHARFTASAGSFGRCRGEHGLSFKDSEGGSPHSSS